MARDKTFPEVPPSPPLAPILQMSEATSYPTILLLITRSVGDLVCQCRSIQGYHQSKATKTWVSHPPSVLADRDVGTPNH